MEVLSLKPFFRVSSSLLQRNPNPSRSDAFSARPYSAPRSKKSPFSLSSSRRGNLRLEPLQTQSDVGSPPFSPLYLLLSVLQSFGGFLLSRGPKLRSWLHGGLPKEERRDFALGSGIGMFLMSTTAAVSKSRVSPFLQTLAGNPTFVSGLVAWALAQTLKVFLNFFVERRWDFGMLFSCGGMPSSHSALCTALTASVALCHGVGDSLFPVCLGFSLIVMYDAIGVRRHAGMQAEVLNKIVEDLFQGHPISERKLKELLGHTPSQVIAGALLGILVACFCCQGCVLAI
ncbi:uncharacterized protein [Typha angustifolia]|uniref:uncharacterized protein n=1 Tax=Typha angustifolia TaxID=59011 RepID=UPI003C2FAA98